MVLSSLMHDIAKQFKDYHKEILFRFAWEMNIDTIEWSTQKTGSTPHDFVLAWQHFHDILKLEGADNVKWVFSVNTIKDNSTPIASLYPGDAYVDWLAVDGYNWGTTQSWSSWQSFDQIFHTTYMQVAGLSSQKPIMISEIGSVEQGGDQPEWFRDMLDKQLIQNYPRIKAIVLFNEDKTNTEGVNWKIEDSQSTLNVVRSSLKSHVYSSQF